MRSSLFHALTMAKSHVDILHLESLFSPLCTAHGVELVDVRHQSEKEGAVLRVLIERPGADCFEKGAGVTLDQCTNVSRAISHLLDEQEDLVPGQFRLEVGSPGVERPLVKRHDYERFAGREVKVTTRAYVSERKNFSGKLVGVRGDSVVLTDELGNDIDIPFLEIQKAHLVFRF
jgi:ribosome maturation factor RimP